MQYHGLLRNHNIEEMYNENVRDVFTMSEREKKGHYGKVVLWEFEYSLALI